MTAPELPPQAACAAPGCVRALADGLLCAGHAKTLRDRLQQLADGLTATSGAVIRGWSTGATSGGPLKSERSIINMDLLDAQAEAPPVLAAWAVWLCAHRTGLVRVGTAAGDLRLIRYDLPWLMEQPEITDLWVQVAGLWSKVQGHRPVRTCTCGGPVWAERGTGGFCSWCAASWAGGALLALGRRAVA